MDCTFSLPFLGIACSHDAHPQRTCRRYEITPNLEFRKLEPQRPDASSMSLQLKEPQSQAVVAGVRIEDVRFWEAGVEILGEVLDITKYRWMR